MKKYIIGFVLGAILFGGITVLAKNIMNSVSMYETDVYSGKFGDGGIHKIYDETSNNICYVFRYGNASGISCLTSK